MQTVGGARFSDRVADKLAPSRLHCSDLRDERTFMGGLRPLH